MGKNKNYERGVRFEREVVKIFKNAGFQGLRTAGSHSPYDVVIWKETAESKKVAYVSFIQCKTHKIKPKE